MRQLAAAFGPKLAALGLVVAGRLQFAFLAYAAAGLVTSATAVAVLVATPAGRTVEESVGSSVHIVARAVPPVSQALHRVIPAIPPLEVAAAPIVAPIPPAPSPSRTAAPATAVLRHSTSASIVVAPISRPAKQSPVAGSSAPAASATATAVPLSPTPQPSPQATPAPIHGRAEDHPGRGPVSDSDLGNAASHAAKPPPAAASAKPGNSGGHASDTQGQGSARPSSPACLRLSQAQRCISGLSGFALTSSSFSLPKPRVPTPPAMPSPPRINVFIQRGQPHSDDDQQRGNHNHEVQVTAPSPPQPPPPPHFDPPYFDPPAPPHMPSFSFGQH
ncbi:MAG: hypothetical protein ACRDHX_10120 [Chloroflexota bacterium]